jgi:hypothetical protein
MFNLNFITTASDCDAISAKAMEMKGNLEFRKASIEAQINSYDPDECNNLVITIALNESTVNNLNLTYQQFPVNSDNYDEFRVRYLKAAKGLRKNQERLASINPTSQVERQKNLEVSTLQLAEIDDFIPSAAARKSEIGTTNSAA